MRFRLKIGLVLLAVGVLPVALLGFASWTVSRDELQRTVGRMQTQAAGDLALFTDRFVATSVERLRLAVAPILFDDYSAGELSAVLSLPYRQLPFVSILAVVNEESAPLAGPVFVETCRGRRPRAASPSLPRIWTCSWRTCRTPRRRTAPPCSPRRTGGTVR